MLHGKRIYSTSPTVDTRIKVVADGQPIFDGVNYGPGADGQYGSSPTDPLAADNTDFGRDDSGNNGIVRNSDRVDYKIQVSLNGRDTTNVVTTVTLSSGQTWQELPGRCQSASSSISADKKTLTCNIGELHEGTVTSFTVTAKVSGNVLNNTIINASVSATGDGANTDTDNSEDVITTAAPRVNLVKKLLKTDYRGDTIDPATGNPGYVIRYGIGLYAEKGSEPLGSDPIVFTDSLSYPSSPVTPDYKLYDWGVDSECGQNANAAGELPYGSVGITALANDTNSVTNSGSINCTQAGGSGSDITVTLSGADYSGATTPSRFSDSSKISSAQNYLVAGYIDVWVPKTDLEDPANADGSTYTLDTLNTFSTVDPDSTSNLSNYGVGIEDDSDNHVSVALTSIHGTGYWENDLSFDGGTPLSAKTGTVKSYPGGLLYPLIAITNGTPSEATTISSCTKIDPSELNLTGNFLKVGSEEWTKRFKLSLALSPFAAPFIVGPDGILDTADDPFTMDYMERLPGADGKLIEVFENHFLDPTNPPIFRNPDEFSPALEFSSVPVVDYQTDTCEDDENSDTVSDWVSDPTADPARFPNGWASVTRIRLTGNFPQDEKPYGTNYGLTVYPEMKVNPALNPAAGLGYANPAEPDAYVGLYSSDINRQSGNTTWRHGTVPTGTNNPFEANYSDRVEMISALLRTNKTITNLTDTNKVKPGDIVSYRIATDLNGAPSDDTDIQLSDTLDNGLEYIVGSSHITPGSPGILVNGVDPSVNPNIEPIVSGQNLIWNLTNVNTGDDIPVVDYDSAISLDVTGGSVANVVVVSETSAAPLDTTSTEPERTSAKSVSLSPTGDYDVIKLLTNIEDATIERNKELKFDLTYANTSATQDVNNAEFIEVFPYNGDGPRDPISDFSDDDNKLEFVSITGTLGGETYLYTNASPNLISNDPCNSSNTPVGDPAPAVCPEGFVDNGGNSVPAATGETVWYDCQAGFSTGACTISKTDVTAIKMSISGSPVLPVGTSRQRFNLVLQPTGNAAGDLYTNNFGSRISENDLVAISNDVTIRVVDSSIGDRVWLDLNGDGIQTSDEPGIQGVTVNLYNDALTLIDTATTDVNGHYAFDKLNAGNYTVRVDGSSLPAGLVQTFDRDGLGSANEATAVLAMGEDSVTWDFGYRGTGSISGRLWEDGNSSGQLDSGESNLTGWTVKITWLGPDGVLGSADDIVFTVTTDSEGKYSLIGLPFGDYQIESIPKDGYKDTYDKDGNKDSIFKLSLTAQNPNQTSVDFGYRKSLVESIADSISSTLATTGVNARLFLILALIVITTAGILVKWNRKSS